MITQKELKEQLHYDPITGIFTRLISNTNTVNVGDIAGSINNKGYLKIKLNGQSYYAHRLAWLYMNGNFTKEMIDHINRIKSDNRYENLREASRSENIINSSLRKDNKTGLRGVCFSQAKNKYKVSIDFNKKRIHVGFFENLESAYKAHKDFTNKLFGEFYPKGM